MKASAKDVIDAFRSNRKTKLVARKSKRDALNEAKAVEIARRKAVRKAMDAQRAEAAEKEAAQ